MYSRPAQCSALARPMTDSGWVTRRSSAIEGIGELSDTPADLSRAHVQMLQDRVAVRAGARGELDRGRELLDARAEVARHARHAEPAEAALDRRQVLVLAQEAREERADGDLLAVARAPRVELVEGVGDLVAGATARAARAGRGHRDAAKDQRLGQRGE